MISNPTGVNRGESVATGHLGKQLGVESLFDNIRSLPTSTNLQTKQDERKVKMRFVKNDSGGVLYAGQLVAWKTAYAGTRVTNPAATAGVEIAGVVDPCFPAAGVPDGNYFWMVVDGPAMFLLDANATSAEFDCLINSGSVAGCVRTGTTSGAIVGRNEASGTAAAGGGTIANATSIWGTFKPN